jgi:hypothetical protein
MTMLRIAQASVALLLSGFIVSCGGGGNSSSGAGTPAPTPPPPTPPLTITTGLLPPALVGTPYSVQLAASNGSGTLTWTASPFVPTGLTLSSSGLISGTPSSVFCGTNLTITVTDSSIPAQSAVRAYPFTAAGLSVDGTQGQVGVYYNNVVQFQCSTEPVTWSLLSGSLPPGLQLAPFSAGSSQLNFPGTPTQGGTFNLAVGAQDASNRTAEITLPLNILPPALLIKDGLMQLGFVNQSFNHVVPTTGGTPPYSFIVSAGALADGLSLNGITGDVLGTPTTAGFYQFNIKVTDTTAPTPFTFEKPYSLLVTPATLPARNDSLTNATPIFPGTYLASLSPYTDAAGSAAPDQDYYVLTGNGGDTYVVAASAEYFLWPSAGDSGVLTAPTEPAIEILNSAGTRMTTCNDPTADNPPAGAGITSGTATFTDACVDYQGRGNGNAYLTLQLPPGSSEQFYVHVFDFEGRARPDFIYSLTVTKQ